MGGDCAAADGHKEAAMKIQGYVNGKFYRDPVTVAEVIDAQPTEELCRVMDLADRASARYCWRELAVKACFEAGLGSRGELRQMKLEDLRELYDGVVADRRSASRARSATRPTSVAEARLRRDVEEFGRELEMVMAEAGAEGLDMEQQAAATASR